MNSLPKSIAALCALLTQSIVASGQTPQGRVCTEIAGTSRPTFQGRLTHQVFPGPPNYEDVRKGDAPEPGYILTLSPGRCLKAAGDDLFELPPTTIERIQIIPDFESSAHNKALDLRRFIGREVSVTGRDGFVAHTAHHRAPVVITLVSIEIAEDATSAYGTAQTTVEAFYHALSVGDGGAASAMMIPSKRSGPFDKQALSSFYGRLNVPLTLIGVTAMGSDTYLARYSYVAGKRRCDGKSIVRTVRIDGFNLIESIQASAGC